MKFIVIPIQCDFFIRPLRGGGEFPPTIFEISIRFYIAAKVGYNTINVQADRLFGYGIQFTAVSGVEEIAVKDVLSVDDPKGQAELGDAADQIWLWDTSAMNWKRYFFRSSRGKVTGWCKEGETTVTTDTMKNGDGFFFRRSSAAVGNVTISGALKAVDATPITLTADRLHFVCNPWPTEISIVDFYNNSIIANPKGQAELGDAADQIWLWDTSTMNWKRYFFRSSRGNVTGWCKDGETVVTSDKIGVGQGFFFRRSSAADSTITWEKPSGI